MNPLTPKLTAGWVFQLQVSYHKWDLSVRISLLECLFSFRLSKNFVKSYGLKSLVSHIKKIDRPKKAIWIRTPKKRIIQEKNSLWMINLYKWNYIGHWTDGKTKKKRRRNSTWNKLSGLEFIETHLMHIWLEWSSLLQLCSRRYCLKFI